MKANGRARGRCRAPDGGQVLLLAGFLLAAAIIIAIGTLNSLQSTRTEIAEKQRSAMVDLFFNTRARAIDFFETVDAGDINTSAEVRLRDYLATQHRSAAALSLELNATLASEGSLSPASEGVDYVDPDDTYADVCAHDDADCYGAVAYDGFDDGLITQDDQVLAAIFWLEVESATGGVEEILIIDVPSTTPT